MWKETVVNRLFSIMDSSSVLHKFVINAEVLHMGNRYLIWGMFWLIENWFSLDIEDR